MVTQNQNRLAGIITGFYFFAAIAEIMGELFRYHPLIVIFKPMMPAILMVLYFITSKDRRWLYFVAMFFSVVTNVLFIPNNQQTLLYAVIAFMFHRIFLLVLIYTLLRPIDPKPVAIGTIPFLLIFFYLLTITSELPENSYILLVIQNVLIALLGGIALANYMLHDNKTNSWLLICSLLFVALQFIVFIEKYYLSNLSPTIFRPIAMGLNTFAFYTFYEFVIATERSNSNAPAAG